MGVTIIYEVNLTIQKDIVIDFLKWLDSHIIEMLEFKGFVNTSTLKISELDYCVQYSVETIEDLNHYFDNYAEKMRNDGLNEFGNKFKASRRIMEVLKKY